ncbi:hypothetical protein O3M35_011149 [Rhynocoris fuscipes]|uniref:Uncharacterized protein n=1 Tax=Rhynocoris fuscipes TaxID=488301 RepID=A0AAW1D1B3_9HEMI
MIHDAGCTWDDSELPDYISSTEEMLNLLESLKHVASNLPMKPNVITVSRSSDDDYCPHEYVEWIQEHVVDVLKSTLECKIKKAYLEE